MISKIEENLGDIDIKNFTVSPLNHNACIEILMILVIEVSRRGLQLDWDTFIQIMRVQIVSSFIDMHSFGMNGLRYKSYSISQQGVSVQPLPGGVDVLPEQVRIHVGKGHSRGLVERQGEDLPQRARHFSPV